MIGLDLYDNSLNVTTAYYSRFHLFHENLAKLDIDDIRFVVAPLFPLPVVSAVDPHSEWCMDEVEIALDIIDNNYSNAMNNYPNMDEVSRNTVEAWYNMAITHAIWKFNDCLNYTH
ncbi:MAG: hypothetical protein PSV16_04990 [Flavobacterium sp.]|nr:hypothetical protein [Flavobacterium sp.]